MMGDDDAGWLCLFAVACLALPIVFLIVVSIAWAAT